MQEKRLTVRLTQYWKILQKTNPIPEFAQFNPATVEDLWPHCCTVRIGARQEQGSDITFTYSYMGKALADMNGRDLTGTVLDHRVKQFLGGTIFEKLKQVVADRVPLEHDGHLLNQGGSMIKYRACFLPFGTEAKDITHIVIGLSFRVFG